MIQVGFLTQPDDRVMGFRVEGHAGWGQEGEDIVCAAVSSAAYLVANTVTEVLAVTPLSLRAEEGEMFFRLEPGDEPRCRSLLQGLRLHLEQLEEQYPGYIQVNVIEI